MESADSPWLTLSHPADAIDKDALRADFGGSLQQQAIGRSKFLIEHLRAGKDNLKLFLCLQCRNVPAQAARVANQFIRIDLENAR